MTSLSRCFEEAAFSISINTLEEIWLPRWNLIGILTVFSEFSLFPNSFLTSFMFQRPYISFHFVYLLIPFMAIKTDGWQSSAFKSYGWLENARNTLCIFDVTMSYKSMNAGCTHSLSRSAWSERASETTEQAIERHDLECVSDVNKSTMLRGTTIYLNFFKAYYTWNTTLD